MPTTGSNEHAVEGWKSLRRRTIEHLVREDVKMTNAPISAETFGRLGFDVRLVVERDVDLSSDRLLFVGGNPRSYKQTLSRVGSIPPAERPVVIVWHTEPLPMPRSAGLRPEPLTIREWGKVLLRDRRINDHYSNARYLRALARTGVVDAFAVPAKAYQAYLAQEGVAVEHVELGYHPGQGRLLDLERDIDVLFLGEFRLRRRKRILRRLRRDGLDVLTLGNYSDPQLWGESRTELLNRTKVMLHIPRLEGHCSDIRMNVTMSTGALLVSEPLFLPDPFVPGVHYVESPLEEMADTVRRYLAEDDARRRITETAHTFLTEVLTLERSFTRLLTLASEGLSRRGQ
jgi:hypothetical protein